MAARLRATAIDWSTTTISAASFLLHFGLLAAIYSDWCDPVVVDDDVARAGVVQALIALAPPPPSEEQPAPVEMSDPVPEPVGPPPRSFVPMDPGWGVDWIELPVDQPTDPDWSELDELTLTDPANAEVVRRAKAFRAALDAMLRSYDSRSSGAQSPRGWLGRMENRGNATIQPPSVTGGVSNAARVVAGMRAGFRACYQRGRGENPDAAGGIQLTLRVGPGGEVVGASRVASGNLPEAVLRCVEARARAAEFDAPEDGSAVIEVPVTFAQ